MLPYLGSSPTSSSSIVDTMGWPCLDPRAGHRQNTRPRVDYFLAIERVYPGGSCSRAGAGGSAKWLFRFSAGVNYLPPGGRARVAVWASSTREQPFSPRSWPRTNHVRDAVGQSEGARMGNNCCSMQRNCRRETEERTTAVSETLSARITTNQARRRCHWLRLTVRLLLMYLPTISDFETRIMLLLNELTYATKGHYTQNWVTNFETGVIYDLGMRIRN